MKYDELYEDGMEKWVDVRKDLFPTQKSSSVKWAVIGSLVGILGTYFFDPERGPTRRALLRDKIFKWTNSLQTYGGKQFQNAKNQLKGWEAGFNRIQHTATNATITPKSKNRDQSFN